MSIINGTPGADALNGTALGDQINGGAGDDILRGFGGADTLDGGAGADRFIWNAGDGADRVEGGADADTAFFAGDRFVVSSSAGHALATNLAETVDLHGVETLNLHGSTAGASFTVGDLTTTDVRQVAIGLDAAANAVVLTGAATGDLFEVQILNGGTLRAFDTVAGVLQTIVASKLDSTDQVTIDAGAGNDSITLEASPGVVGPAPMSAHGGTGDDTLTGSAGSDLLFGDAGDDRIVSGGGADRIDGGAGADIQLISGGNGVDTVTLSALNGHLRETVGGVTSDVVNVETLNISPLGQGDTVSIGDLSTTSTRTINIDLSAARGGQDSAVDTVNLPSSYVAGLSTYISTVSLTSPLDGSSLQAVYAVNGAATETINVTALGAGDVIKLMGGAGDDYFVTTGFANHRTIQVDGGLGTNGLSFDGTAGNDTIAVSTNAGGVDVAMNGSVLFNMINVAHVGVGAGTGQDTIRLLELGGGPSGLVKQTADLSGPDFNPDGEADTVVTSVVLRAGEALNGSQYGDLSRQDFNVYKPDDHPRGSIYIDGMDAKDRIVVTLTGDGPLEVFGPFNQTDFRLGSADDTLNWTVDKRGHDSVDGGAGTDTLNIGTPPWLRQGDDRSWTISLTDAGGPARVAMHHVSDPSPAGVVDLVVDLTSVERVSLTGGSGSDLILIGDQSGTAVRHVDIEVGGEGPDGDRDFVLLDGTAGADTIFVAQTSGDLTVNGLAASAVIHNLDSFDHVFIRSGAGNDFIDLSNHNPGRGVVHLDAGLGNDTMIGGFGAESFEFHGGAGGQDVVIGFRGHALGGEADVVSVFGTSDHSLADLVAHNHIFQSGSNVVLTDGSGAFVTLTNVNLASLSASDFLF